MVSLIDVDDSFYVQSHSARYTQDAVSPVSALMRHLSRLAVPGRGVEVPRMETCRNSCWELDLVIVRYQRKRKACGKYLRMSTQRPKGSIRYVSINQNCRKYHQVCQMADLYLNDGATIIWPTNSVTHRACARLHAPKRLLLSPGVRKEIIASIERHINKASAMIKIMLMRLLDRPVDSLLFSEYWNKTCIIQGIALASVPSITQAP